MLAASVQELQDRGARRSSSETLAGTQFTCFTSTKLQILTQKTQLPAVTIRSVLHWDNVETKFPAERARRDSKSGLWTLLPVDYQVRYFLSLSLARSLARARALSLSLSLSLSLARSLLLSLSLSLSGQTLPFFQVGSFILPSREQAMKQADSRGRFVGVSVFD